MPAQPNWTNGLGFRHLIEDGLAILTGRTMTPDRREYVVADLSELVLQAKRGADLVRGDALSVNIADKNAFESFSLLGRYLDHPHEEHWNQMLGKAEEAFNELRKGAAANLDDDQRAAAADLLRRVLSRLIREPKPGVPSTPEEFRIGG